MVLFRGQVKQMDIRKFANLDANPSDGWVKAGTARMNKKGEIGAALKISLYANFDEKGCLLLSVGDGKTVKVTPEVREKVALFKVGGTTLSVSLQHLGNVLMQHEGAYAIINAPPAFDSPIEQEEAEKPSST